MIIQAKKQNQSAKDDDYTAYIEQFFTTHKYRSNDQSDKTKTQSTLRPYTANDLLKTLKQANNIKTHHIQELIQRKTLLSMDYQESLGQSKFQTFLLGNNSSVKSPNFNQEQQNSKYDGGQEEQISKSYRSAKLHNSFGVRRSRSAIKIRGKQNPQNFIKSPLFNMQYHPLNIFPCRKNVSLKLKSQRSNCSKQKAPMKISNPYDIKIKLINSIVKEADSFRMKSCNSKVYKRQNIDILNNQKLRRETKMIQGTKMIIHR